MAVREAEFTLALDRQAEAEAEALERERGLVLRLVLHTLLLLAVEAQVYLLVEQMDQILCFPRLLQQVEVLEHIKQAKMGLQVEAEVAVQAGRQLQEVQGIHHLYQPLRFKVMQEAAVQHLPLTTVAVVAAAQAG